MRAAAIILAVLLGAGCQPAPRPAAGMAGLRVHVLAEPKAGAQPSPQRVSVYDTPAPADYGAFAKVDYSNLDQIVVWLEPVDAPAPPSSGGKISVDIDPSKTSRGIGGVTSVGQRIVLHNVSSSPQTIYSVSDGNEFDIESVPVGGRAEYTVRSAGLIEILTNSAKENPVQIYAAPTPWVRMTRSGESVEFNNLAPGQYRLASWHPRLPGTQRTAKLSADQVSDASIDVTVNTLPKVNSGG